MTRHRHALLVFATMLVLAACTDQGESVSETAGVLGAGASTTTAQMTTVIQVVSSTTNAEAATTTTVTTSTLPTTTSTDLATTTTVYYAAPGSLYPTEPLASDGASGSGCTPGSGDLPPGVWFGYVESANATSLQFDLACWYFGDLAWEIADTFGHTAENDYYVVNQNPALRSVRVNSGAVVHHIDPMSIGHDPMAYADWLLEPPGYLECPFGFCPLWLFVNDGEVTEILEQYVP